MRGSSGARWLRGAPLTFELYQRAAERRAIAARVARSEQSRSARSPIRHCFAMTPSPARGEGNAPSLLISRQAQLLFVVVVVFERHFQLHAILLEFAVPDLDVLFHDFRDPQLPQRLGRAFNRALDRK